MSLYFGFLLLLKILNQTFLSWFKFKLIMNINNFSCYPLYPEYSRTSWKVGWGGGGALLHPPHPFLQIFKDDVNGFSSISEFAIFLQTEHK